MKDLVKALVPMKYKFFSVGSTVGMTIAFGLSIWFEPLTIKIMFFGSLVLAAVGLWDIKNEFDL